MSGIAGWIDFAGDISRHRGAVRTMVATLANRGPDGERLWVGPHAVLGHRRLAVAGSLSDGQPAVASRDGAALAVLAYDGEVYNLAEVRARLTAAGERVPDDNDDAAVLVHAYLCWGDSFVEQLDGPFAIAVWDARTEQLLLIRDRLGIKPLYYYPLPTGVVFGSEPKAVLAHPLVEAVADEHSLREAFAFTATAGHGLFRGMAKLHPASVVSVSSTGTKVRSYWALTAQPHADDRPTTVRRVRELLEGAVRRQLQASGPTHVLLSGGIDSSSVAALAGAALSQRQTGELRTYTVGYPSPQGPRPGGPEQGSDLEFAVDVAAWLGADHTEIRLGAVDMTDPVTRARMVECQQDAPTPVCAYPASFRQLCLAVAEQTNTALSGQRSDTLFDAFMNLDDPAVLTSGTLPWVAFGQLRGGRGSMLGTGLFDPGLLARLDLAGYCADQYRTDTAKAPQLEGTDPAERRMRAQVYTLYRGWFEMNVSLDESAAMTLGLEVRQPFADTDLLQYVYNVPWAMKMAGGRRKGLLRDAVADLLPEHILNRPPNSFPIVRDPAYLTVLRERLAEVASDRDSPVRPLLDAGAVARAVAGEQVGTNPWLAQTNVEMVLQLDSWLRLFRVRLAL